MATSEVEYSQHIVPQSVALILAVGTRSRPTSGEMTRMPMVMQWCLADTFLAQMLVGLWWSDTAEILGVLVADNQGGWQLAGHNHCCMNSVLCNHATQQEHYRRCMCIGISSFRTNNSEQLVQIRNKIITGGVSEVQIVWQM